MATIPRMIPTQRLPASLTPLDVALMALLDRLEPVAPIELPLAQALGCVAADMPPLKAIPPYDTAAADGWAFCAGDLVGASSYSPLPLAISPVWVEAGAAIPQGCDCVIDTDLVDQTGPMVQVLAEAIPGQGVRRIGGDVAAGSFAIASGRRVRPLDLLIARAAGLERLTVRRPRLRIINIPATSGATATAQLISENARGAGADVIDAEATWSPSAAAASAAPTQRSGRWPGAAKFSPMASPCSRAEPLPLAGLEKYPSLCCRARRIRRSRHGGRWHSRCWTGCPGGSRGRR